MIGIILGIISACIAGAKGFKPLRWILALGIIGLITVICMPSASTTEISRPEAEKRAGRANLTGAWMAWINVAIFAVVLLIISVNA